jgi:hypothetical protein
VPAVLDMNPSSRTLRRGVGRRAVFPAPDTQPPALLPVQRRRSFTASGVFGAAGIVDAAEVHVRAGRIRRKLRLRMAVDPQLWDPSPGRVETLPWVWPRLTITASGALRPLDLDVIRTWL